MIRGGIIDAIVIDLVTTRCYKKSSTRRQTMTNSMPTFAIFDDRSFLGFVRQLVEGVLAALVAQADLAGFEFGAALVAFGDFIKEKTAVWEIVQSITEANKLAQVGEDFTSKLMEDTALNTIQIAELLV